MSHQSHGPIAVCRRVAAIEGCGMACQNSGAVWTNCPINAGSRGLEEKTGASVVSPLGLQKPLVVHSVNGHSMPSSRTSWKMLWYCTRIALLLLAAGWKPNSFST